MKTEFVTRDRILKLLSDEEIARVSTAETAAGLKKGEEYLDLEELTRGVRHANGEAITMGRVLPRKSVATSTWTKILDQLGSAHI